MEKEYKLKEKLKELEYNKKYYSGIYDIKIINIQIKKIELELKQIKNKINNKIADAFYNEDYKKLFELTGIKAKNQKEFENLQGGNK